MSEALSLAPGLVLEKNVSCLGALIVAAVVVSSTLVIAGNLHPGSPDNPGGWSTSDSTGESAPKDCPPSSCQSINAYSLNVRYTNLIPKDGDFSKVDTVSKYITNLDPKPTIITLQEVENAKGMNHLVGNLGAKGLDCNVIDPAVAMRTMTCWDRTKFSQVKGPMSERQDGELTAGTTSHEAVDGRPIDGLILESKVLTDHNGTKTTSDDHGAMLGVNVDHPVHGVSEAGKVVAKKCRSGQKHCSSHELSKAQQIYQRYKETMDKKLDLMAAQRAWYATIDNDELAQLSGSDENTQLGDATVLDPGLFHAHIAPEIDGKANPSAMTCNFDNPDQYSQQYLDPDFKVLIDGKERTDPAMKEKIGTFENGTLIDWACVSADSKAIKYVSNLPLTTQPSIGDHREVGIRAYLYAQS